MNWTQFILQEKSHLSANSPIVANPLLKPVLVTCTISYTLGKEDIVAKWLVVIVVLSEDVIMFVTIRAMMMLENINLQKKEYLNVDTQIATKPLVFIVFYWDMRSYTLVLNLSSVLSLDAIMPHTGRKTFRIIQREDIKRFYLLCQIKLSMILNDSHCKY